MHCLDLDFPTPAELLAADEALLDWCEAGWGDEMLLLWEPPQVFVVVGYANKVAAEVDVEACGEKSVPIFRRCTGGGAVVQIPGGLNYSLLLRIREQGPTRNISATNGFIMERNRAAVQAALGTESLKVAVQGHTDLAVAPPGAPGSAWLKVAGNSQRRRRRFLLFHGTFLLHCDLTWIGTVLRMPSQAPGYRRHRPHAEFVANLNLPAGEVKTALRRAWGAEGKPARLPRKEIETLAREKYSAPAWNCKF